MFVFFRSIRSEPMNKIPINLNTYTNIFRFFYNNRVTEKLVPLLYFNKKTKKKKKIRVTIDDRMPQNITLLCHRIKIFVKEHRVR